MLFRSSKCVKKRVNCQLCSVQSQRKGYSKASVGSRIECLEFAFLCTTKKGLFVIFNGCEDRENVSFLKADFFLQVSAATVNQSATKFEVKQAQMPTYSISNLKN